MLYSIISTKPQLHELPHTQPPLSIKDWGLKIREGLLAEDGVVFVEYFRRARNPDYPDMDYRTPMVVIAVNDNPVDFDKGVIHRLVDEIAEAHNRPAVRS